MKKYLSKEEIINIIKYNIRTPIKGDSLTLFRTIRVQNNIDIFSEKEMELVHSQLVDEMLDEIAENGRVAADKEDDQKFATFIVKLNGKDNSKAEETEVVKTFVKNKVKGTYDLAVYLCKKYNMITVGDKNRELFIYKDGIYCRGENEIVLPEIQRILNNNITKSAKTETIHKIHDHTSKPRSIFENTDVRYIPVLNGVYDVVDKQLLEHSPDYHFKYQIPVKYDPNATCPKIEAFFDQVFTEVQRQTIEEWIGYCFYRNYMFKKALIIVGEGDTGKTTFLELLSALIGKENKSGVSLHKISGDKFSSAQLYEKHVNIFDELSAEDVHDTANFKIATGGGSIMGEYKFGDQFSFMNFSKLIFACNKIPDVKDMNDEAYFNRWMVIHLSKTIDKKITNFITTLTTDEELSGLFNLAIKGLDRLLEQQGFSYKYSGIDTKLEMMRSASSIASFVSDGIEREIGAEITKEELYNAYTNFCEERNLSPESIAMIGKKLPFYAQYVKDAQVYGLSNGKIAQVRGWRNVVVKLTEEEKQKRETVDNWVAETSKLVNENNGLSE